MSTIDRFSAPEWGPAGMFPGMPTDGSISARLPNGASVGVFAPLAPGLNAEAVLFFGTDRPPLPLVTDQPTVPRARDVVESHWADLQVIVARAS